MRDSSIRPNADPEHLALVWGGLEEAGDGTVQELARVLGVEGDVLLELAVGPLPRVDRPIGATQGSAPTLARRTPGGVAVAA